MDFILGFLVGLFIWYQERRMRNLLGEINEDLKNDLEFWQNFCHSILNDENNSETQKADE